jgi:hypothetical protein
MSFLSDIANRLKGSKCERLIKQAGNELVVSGVSFGVGSFKVDVGNYSNKIKEFYKVSQILIALDNTQYLLCGVISQIKDNQSFKEDCWRMQMQLIRAFGQLQALFCISKTEELEKELAKWVRYMNRLNKESIEYLKPGPRMITKGGSSELQKIMNYQGINEEQMQEALKILK